MEKSLEIFGRTHRYDFDSEIDLDIEAAQKLCEKIREPQVLSYCGLETVDFFLPHDNHFMGNDCIKFIYEMQKEKTGDIDIRKCLLACSTEDKEWTKVHNKGYTDIFYRLITFHPEIREMVVHKLEGYIEELKELQLEMQEEERKEKEETEKRRQKWSLAKTYTRRLPRGGEDGCDGYIDAEYTSASGTTIRMVNRDVFDFGTYSYPKRLEGTDNMFKWETWTEEERALARWLSEFGEFRGIRM